VRRDSFLVTDDGSTPDQPLEACLYCKAAVGTEHEQGCVMRRRTVVVRAVVEYVHVIPEDWTPESVEFHLNEGTWCFCPSDLQQHLDAHTGQEDGCLCFHGGRVEYVREATEQDEATPALSAASLTD